MKEAAEVEGAALVARRQALGDGVRTQKGKASKNGWTKEDKARFLEVLAETCNVSEAAREVGRARAGAYALKARDAAFARGWDAAIEQGYAEIEAMLMRAVLFGDESEETVLDGEGAVTVRKVKRGRNLTVALRLLTYRHQRMMLAQGGNGPAETGPASPDAIARVGRVLEEIRQRRAAAAAAAAGK